MNKKTMGANFIVGAIVWITTIIILILFTLKVSGITPIAWVWVFSPLWIGTGVFLFLIALALIIAASINANFWR